MTEHDKNLTDHLDSSLNLQKKNFNEVSHEIREQLMSNRETIDRYNTWQKSADYDSNLLSDLTEEQQNLERYFNSRWDYKVSNPHNMLKFDKIYSSQAFIFVEWHAGNSFYHIYKRYFKFQENGFCNVTVEKISRSIEEITERITSMKTDYRSIYTVDDDRAIKIETRHYEFEGTIIHDAIAGKEFKLGSYLDGIIQKNFEILVPVN
ncbi:MAG: hypothetical protein IPM36_09520 [Lewinellaceae bacterium]|nr:hypothetical protein [Lewinellaceae bacterium]